MRRDDRGRDGKAGSAAAIAARVPREQGLFDEAANDVRGGDVKLLEELCRLRRRPQA